MSRPIDADELIEKIRKLPNAGIRWFVSAEAVFDTILNAPPIEPERKKGTWNQYYRMHSGDTFACSRCGSCFVVLQGVDKMNYCPNCGAEMKEDI